MLMDCLEGSVGMDLWYGDTITTQKSLSPSIGKDSRGFCHQALNGAPQQLTLPLNIGPPIKSTVAEDWQDHRHF